MNSHFSTGTASTFLDLLNLVDGRLKELLPKLLGALDQIKSDFKVQESVTYFRMERTIGDMEDLMGTLQAIGKMRHSQDDVTISLPADLADRAESHAGDVQYALDNAASVFAGLEHAITGGYVSGGDMFVASVLRLTSRALIDVSEKEAATMTRVASLIRQELGARANANISKAA